MDYSVFVLDIEENVDTNDFISNTDMKTAVAGMAAGAVENLVGFSFYDKYTNKLKKEKSVGLTGSAIIDVKINTFILKRTNYKVDFNGAPNLKGNLEDIFAKDIKHVITVKGRLEPADTLFGMGTELAKKKDLSRIWKWANIPIMVPRDNLEKKEYEKEYYRDLIVVISSADQRRFRGFVYKKVFVESYEEFYDKNGEGTFNLVMVKMIKPDTQSFLEVKTEGPNFTWSGLSLVKDIDKAANTVKKDVHKAAETSEKVLGKDNIVTEKLKIGDKYTTAGVKIADGANNVIGGGSLADEISDQAGAFRKNFFDEKDQKVKSETKVLDNGSTETIVVKSNPDGSKTVTVTTKNKDGSEKITETRKESYDD